MRLRSLLLSYLCTFWISGAVWAAAPSRTYTYVTGQTIDPSQVTTNEDGIFSYLQAGVDTYAAGTVNAAALADSAVTSAKINDGTIVNADVSSSAAITYSKLSFSNNIVAGDIAAGAVDAGDMATTGTIADDKVFVADSATAATWRTITNCTDTGGNHLNYTQSTNSFSCGTSASTSSSAFVGSFTRDTTLASGTQAVTGLGLTPVYVEAFCGQTSSREISWGFSDGTNNGNVHDDPTTADTYSGDNVNAIEDRESTTLSYEGTIGSFISGGFTVTWTRTSTPSGTLTCRFLAKS